MSNFDDNEEICSDMLKMSLSNFNLDDDIYVRIQAGIEKLDHYYDKISPMVGIALLLNPTLKKDFLRSGLARDWILCVEENFQSSFLLLLILHLQHKKLWKITLKK